MVSIVHGYYCWVKLDMVKESMNKTHFRLRHGFGNMVLVAHGIDARGICM